MVGSPKSYRNKAASVDKSSKANMSRSGNKNKNKTSSALGGGEDGKVELYHVEWIGYAEKTWEPKGNLPEYMIRAYFVNRETRHAKKMKRMADGDDWTK